MFFASQIQASGQRKEVFEGYQREAGIEQPLVIPLHNNTRWGIAQKMCARAYELRKVQLTLIRRSPTCVLAETPSTGDRRIC